MPLNCSVLETHSRLVSGPLVAQPGAWDIQRTLNQRCSGFTSKTDCRFNLMLDSEEAKGWGPGVIKVWHRCIPREKIEKKCGTVLTGHGFIMSTSYPKYYMGAQVCSWKVEVEPQELVLVTVVDLHLEGSPQCRDVLKVNQELSLCGELRTKTMYISDSSVFLTFNTSASHQYIYPSRGFLVEYTTLSCTPPPTLPTSSLLYSNQTHATYRCNQGLLFQHSQLPTHTTLCSGSTLESIPDGSCTGDLSTPCCTGELSTPSSVLLSLQDGDYVDPGLWFQEVLLPLVLLSFLLILSLASLILLALARRHRAEEDRIREIYGNNITTLIHN